MNQRPVYYGAEEVRRVLNWPLVNGAVEEALKAVSAQDEQVDDGEGVGAGAAEEKVFVSQPQRSVTSASRDRGQLLLTMPAFVGNYRLGGASVPSSTLACKLVTSFQGNGKLQPALPNIAANILLFSVKTGELETIMAGTDITTWRTAAASVVATKYMYFKRCEQQQKAITVAIIGCGVQGGIHAAAMCANFRVLQVNLYNRTQLRAQQLAQELTEQFRGDSSQLCENQMPQIQVCETAREAVQQADVICVATYSPHALFSAADLQLHNQRAIHINAVGAGAVHFGEVDSDIYVQSQVYVDSLASASRELQNFPVAIAGELGALINSGQSTALQGITVFQSMGMAAEDACVAAAVQSALQSSAECS